MPPYTIKAAVIAILVACWLRFLLPATGWLFYELHHLTGMDWVYWGYTVFRGGGYFFGTWPYQTAACVAVGVVIYFILARRGKRRAALEA